MKEDKFKIALDELTNESGKEKPKKERFDICDCFYLPVKCNCKIIELHKNFVEIASKETIVDRLVEMSETIEELEKQNKEMLEFLIDCRDDLLSGENLHAYKFTDLIYKIEGKSIKGVLKDE